MSLARIKKKPAWQYFDSFSVRQANARNFALAEHQKIVNKTIKKEAHRRELELNQQMKATEKELDEIHTIFPIRVPALDKVYKERKSRMDEVYTNIVNCYMRRQYRNKKAWQEMVNANILPARPAASKDHIDFVRGVFPEIYNRQVDQNFIYSHDTKADIYEYGKAAHDRKCMSSKAEPVGISSGLFPANKPINIRFWKPPEEYLSDGLERSKLSQLMNPNKDTINKAPMRKPSGKNDEAALKKAISEAKKLQTKLPAI